MQESTKKLQQLNKQHKMQLEQQVLTCASRCGLIDMYGWLTPAVDGFGLNIMLPVVELMGSMVRRALELRQTCKNWFDRVEGLGYFHG